MTAWAILSGELLAQFNLPIQPLPMPRARAGQSGQGQGRHHYLPKRFTDYLEELRWAMLEARRRAGQKSPTLEAVGLELLFHRQGRARCDLDNLVKGVWDAGNELLWHDDSQIEFLEARKVIGQAPRIAVRAVILRPLGVINPFIQGWGDEESSG